MKFKEIIFNILLFNLLILTSKLPLFSSDKNNYDYYPLDSLVSSLNLNLRYDYMYGQITIYDNINKIVLMLDSPYILMNNKKYYLNCFITVSKGQIYIPYFLINKITFFFKGDKISHKSEEKINENTINKDIFLNIIKNEEQTKNSDSENSEENNDTENNYFPTEKKDNFKVSAIIIDPGHGGSDPGAIGFDGTKEKDIVLKIALILKDKLKELYPGKKIILTRESDVFLSLEKRANIANYVFNKYGHSLFVSIHVNASRTKKSYGFETWYLVEEMRRNIIKKGELTDDNDVESVLNSMLNDEIYSESKYLAEIIQKNLEKEIGYVSKNRGIKEQTYFVIKKSIMPAVLVEVGFNTNKYEEIRLTKQNYLNKIARGIKQGVEDFIYEFDRTLGFTK